jgi:hypothetical protein
MIFKFAARGDLFLVSDNGKMLWSPYGTDLRAHESMACQNIAEQYQCQSVHDGIRYCLVMLTQTYGHHQLDHHDWKSFFKQIENARRHIDLGGEKAETPPPILVEQ